jgi:hypothetical protein
MAGLIALWTKPVRARANAIDLARIEIPPFPAGFDAQARQELIQSTDPGFEDRSGYNPARLALLAIEAFFHLGNSNSPNCYSPISFRAALRIVNTLDPPKSGPQANRNGVIAVLLIDRLDKTLTKDEQLRLFLE